MFGIKWPFVSRKRVEALQAECERLEEVAAGEERHFYGKMEKLTRQWNEERMILREALFQKNLAKNYEAHILRNIDVNTGRLVVSAVDRNFGTSEPQTVPPESSHSGQVRQSGGKTE